MSSSWFPFDPEKEIRGLIRERFNVAKVSAVIALVFLGLALWLKGDVLWLGFGLFTFFTLAYVGQGFLFKRQLNKFLARRG